MDLLRERLNAVVKEKNWSAAILLSEQAVRQLKDRLDKTQSTALQAVLAEARKNQVIADRKRVAGLVSQLASSDASVRKSAHETLTGMSSRAIGPVLEELDALLQADTPNAELERRLLNVLRQIAPELTGYDPDKSPKARRQVIENWRKTL
jgi:transposase